MTFELFTNFWLTNCKSEYNKTREQDTCQDGLYLMLTENNRKGYVQSAGYCYQLAKRVLVYYEDVDVLKKFLEEFVRLYGDGDLYSASLNDILNMNLGI